MNEARRKSLLLLLAAIALIAVPIIPLWQGSDHQAWSILLRAGIVLGVVWLAAPELRRIRWTRSLPFLVGSAVLAITLVARPKLVPFLLCGLVLAWLGNWILRRFIRSIRNPGP